MVCRWKQSPSSFSQWYKSEDKTWGCGIWDLCPSSGRGSELRARCLPIILWRFFSSSWFCKFLYFTSLGKFSAVIYSNSLSALLCFSCLSGTQKLWTWTPSIVLQVPEALVTLSSVFPLARIGWSVVTCPQVHWFCPLSFLLETIQQV